MLFSIIIPAYNAASFLKRCIDSVCSQSFKDYEIIVVNDGSTDDTDHAVEELQRDHAIKYCTIAHGGAGTARNAGLEKACGDYIIYLDADDYWLDDTFLETLHAKIEQNQTDIFMFRMKKVDEAGNVLKRYEKPPFIYDNIVMRLDDVYADLVRDGQALASSCNKCIRRGLLNEHHIRFLENIYTEDIDWVLQLFSAAEYIRLLNLDVYAYTQHHSVSRSTVKEAPDSLAYTIDLWGNRLKEGKVPCAKAVAGLIAFEYGICMGSNHLLNKEHKKMMKSHTYLLNFGLDRKTILIHKVYRILGYTVTCNLIRLYLFLRRVW